MKNWDKVKLRELLTESRIESNNPDTNRRIRVKLNVGGVEQRPSTNDKEGATKYFIRKAGQFIYGKQNLHKGAFGIVPVDLDGYESSADIPAFDVNESCYPEWIFYFFKQGDFYLTLEDLAKGVGSKRINTEQLFELSIPLPTKKQQKKILSNIQKLEKDYFSFKYETDLQFELIASLRQSILQDAFKGKLTSQWRSQNIEIESAYELLKRLEVEKLTNDSKKRVFNVKNEEIPYELPKDWLWCKFGELIKFMAYGTSQKTDDNFKNVPVLRMGNITANGKINYSNLKYIDPKHNDLPKLYLENGDIVFNRTNSYELVGKSAVYDQGSNKYTLASYLIKISIFSDYLDPYLINYYIISPICRQTQIEPQIIAQTNQANFSGSKLREILFPLIPLSEQQIILRKIKNFMKSCNELEEQIQQNKIDSEYLIQMALTKAFGMENQAISKKKQTFKEKIIQKEEYFSVNNENSVNMELVELLQQNGKMSAINLWRMSKYQKDIDSFYEALKQEIEVLKTIKETEKGYLELIA